MARLVDQHNHFLRYLTTVSSVKKIEGILRAASDGEIKALTELIGNLFHGGVSCRISALLKLRKDKGELDSIWNTKTSIDKQRIDLIQNSKLIIQSVKVAEPFIKNLSHV